MLKKMQNRFILAAMVAFGLVMLLLVAGINIASCVRMSVSQKEMLERISDYNKRIEAEPGEKAPPISDMPWAGGPDREFTKRFFVVRCDEEGRISLFHRDYISSIDEQAAEEYAESILEKREETGRYGAYRYLVECSGSGYEITFLNVSEDMAFAQTLLLVSMIIGAGSFLVVTALAVLLSGCAIRPYAKNIERQKQFITNAGHELKTPITSIITSADILACDYGENEWVENVRNQAARLTRLTEDLIALSRLDEDRPLSEQVYFSLSEAAWEISESIAPLAKAKGRRYEQHIEENLRMKGDRRLIQQLLSILLENAVKYSPEEGSLRLDICRKRGRIRIEVSNTCELEDDTDIERWFDRFYRQDRARSGKNGGTGIGLSMAQAIVEAHGGEISIRSRGKEEIICRVLL